MKKFALLLSMVLCIFTACHQDHELLNNQELSPEEINLQEEAIETRSRNVLSVDLALENISQADLRDVVGLEVEAGINIPSNIALDFNDRDIATAINAGNQIIINEVPCRYVYINLEWVWICNTAGITIDIVLVGNPVSMSTSGAGKMILKLRDGREIVLENTRYTLN